MAEFAAAIQTLTRSSAIIRCSGDLDEHSFERLEEEFGKALEAGALGLALDFSAFGSITSAGLGAVVNLSLILADRGGRLLVAEATPQMRDLVEMLGLDETLTMVESLDQAKKMAAAVRPS